MSNPVFTIGHSTHAIEYFIDLLKRHSVNVVADVRSTPFSRMNPDFDQKALTDHLKKHGINYVFLGRELGARPQDACCYTSEVRVDYDKLAVTSLFQTGLERVIEGAKNYRIALMCAERAPLDCHRSVLISRYLADKMVSVNHITSEGHAVAHNDLVAQLVAHYFPEGMAELRSPAEKIAEAYRIHGRLIAFHVKTTEKSPKKIVEKHTNQIDMFAA